MEGLSGSGRASARPQLSSASGQRVDPNWPSNVLDLLLAPALELNRHLAFNVVVNRAGNAEPPGSANCSSRAATFTPSP